MCRSTDVFSKELGNFPAEVSPRRKQVKLQIFFSLCYHLMCLLKYSTDRLEFLSFRLNKSKQTNFTELARSWSKSGLLLWTQNTMPSLNFSGKWMDCKLSPTCVSWGALFLENSIGFWRLQSCWFWESHADLWHSTTREPDYDEWEAFEIGAYQLFPSLNT